MFGTFLAGIRDKARDISSGAPETFHKAAFYGEVRDRHDNWNRLCRTLRCLGIRVDPGDDQVDLEADHLVGQLVQPLGLSVGKPIFDQDVAANHVAALGQPALKCLDEVNLGRPWRDLEIADSINLCRLLGRGGANR